MLVLSRKETERIRLGKSIVVTVVRVSGDKVRLGIEAPPDVLVLRDELHPLEHPVGVGEKHAQRAAAASAAAAVPAQNAEPDSEPGPDHITATETVAEFEVDLSTGLAVDIPA